MHSKAVKMLLMSKNDNVGVVLAEVHPGDYCRDEASGLEVAAIETIEFGHKIALCDFSVGDEIIKYNTCIGKATREIRKGAWVHRHNLESERGR